MQFWTDRKFAHGALCGAVCALVIAVVFTGLALNEGVERVISNGRLIEQQVKSQTYSVDELSSVRQEIAQLNLELKDAVDAVRSSLEVRRLVMPDEGSSQQGSQLDPALLEELIGKLDAVVHAIERGRFDDFPPPRSVLLSAQKSRDWGALEALYQVYARDGAALATDEVRNFDYESVIGRFGTPSAVRFVDGHWRFFYSRDVAQNGGGGVLMGADPNVPVSAISFSFTQGLVTALAMR